MRTEKDHKRTSKHWNAKDVAILVKEYGRQMKLYKCLDFAILCDLFPERGEGALETKLNTLGLPVRRKRKPRAFRVIASGVRMPDRMASSVKEPLRVAKWVLGERFDYDTLKLDGRVSRIDDIMRAANAVNVSLGAHQIANKSEWVIHV